MHTNLMPENGKKEAEGEYRDGRQQGKWSYWHENGQKHSEGEWRDGRLHGKWTWWHENGTKKSEGEYRDGEKHGKWTVHFSETYGDYGSPKQVEHYDNGKLIKTEKK